MAALSDGEPGGVLGQPEELRGLLPGKVSEADVSELVVELATVSTWKIVYGAAAAPPFDAINPALLTGDALEFTKADVESDLVASKVATDIAFQNAPSPRT